MRLPREDKAGMRAPGIVYVDDRLLASAQKDRAFDQVANVAFLPGIQQASLAMPDRRSRRCARWRMALSDAWF